MRREGSKAMSHKVLRVLALGAAIALAVGVTFGGRVSAFFQRHRSASQTSAAGSERKVLYWYDAMSPQHHYDKPGKAPDGMDLVPQYAEDSTSQSATTTSARAPSGERKVLYWYDAMSPQHHYNKPGKAPDGMDLVPQYAEDNTSQSGSAATAAAMPAGTVKIAPDKQQLIGVRTETVERQSLVRTVRTTGQLTGDETKLAHVHVKVNGYIDKGYVDYIGQLVKKGQPLFTLYSPDLVATEEEYLIAKRGAKDLGTSQFPEVSQGSQSLLRSTRERLKLWDISDEP